MGHAAHSNETSDRPSQGFETRDTNVRAVIGFGIGLILFLVVVQLILLGTLRPLVRHREPAPAEVAPINVTEELKRVRVDENDALSRYARIPGESEYVRIPIDRAMDLFVKKGVPFGKGKKTDVQINTRVPQ